MVILTAHDLISPPNSERRLSERLLHNTVLNFWPNDRTHASWGFTYDISAQGFAVRTLAPPPDQSEVWVEIRPALQEAVVRLRAKVMWARSHENAKGIRQRKGFGARITGGNARHLARWREGYTQLLWRRYKSGKAPSANDNR